MPPTYDSIYAGCLNEPKSTPPPFKKSVSIRATLFFDGTNNNMANTQGRLDYDDWKRPNSKSTKTDGATAYEKFSDKNLADDFSGDSYTNDFSNVVFLERMLKPGKEGCPDYDAYYSIYTSGTSTDDLKSDSSLMGGGWAIGGTGIESKVKMGLDELVKKILSTSKAPDKTISKLTIDTCGFSRGAAAARNVVYVILEDEKEKLATRLSAAGWTVNGCIEIDFVGLFDTVSHHGKHTPWSSGPGNDYAAMADDVKVLHLDAIKVGKNVIQFSAADEFRHNFPLTTLEKSGKTQISIPGVHSDVGGSYRDNVNELNVKMLQVDPGKGYDAIRKRYDLELKRLVAEGWFKKDEPSKNALGEIVDKGNSIVLNRFSIRNTYSKIPLLLMKNHAEKALLVFNNVKVKVDVQSVIDNEEILKKVWKLIGPLGNESWKTQPSIVQELRHKHCHFNAHYDGGVGVNDPEWSGKDSWTGQRKRREYAG
ncbi:MAG: DUF2235 domain-containing protein [Chitinophagaceae bacterium]